MKNQCGRDQATTDVLLLQHCAFLSTTDTPPKEQIYRLNLQKCDDIGDQFCPENTVCMDRLDVGGDGSYGTICACPAGTMGNIKNGCVKCEMGKYNEIGMMDSQMDSEQSKSIRFS